MYIQILGLVAGAFTVFASLPQIIKIIKTKQTKDISLPMYIILSFGILLWIIYGIIPSQASILITNIVFEIFNLTILFLKIKHG